MGLILGLSTGLGFLLVFTSLMSVRSLSEIQKRSRRNSIPKIAQAHVWSDLVDDLASAVRAGVPLPKAFESLASHGPSELHEILDQTVIRYRATGDFVNALSVFRDGCADARCDKIVGALTIAHSVGGSDLGVLLRTLAEALRDDAKIRSEIIARQSWTINGARLAVGAPWVTAILLSTHSDAWSAYTSPGGRNLLLLCAISSIAAYLIMRQIGKLPVEGRLLS